MQVLSLGAIIVQVVVGGLSPPQRFPLGIPIKIEIIKKKKSRRGTMGRGKSFVTFFTPLIRDVRVGDHLFMDL